MATFERRFNSFDLEAEFLKFSLVTPFRIYVKLNE